MENKNLLQSKKAQSAWLGSLVVSAIVFGGWKVGIPIEYVSLLITAVGGLFGSQILSQGVQDVFKKPEQEQKQTPEQEQTKPVEEEKK
jgi:hypothetical protein